MSAACVVASYGDPEIWGPLGERALWSAHAQTKAFDEIYRVHLTDGTLQEARNSAIETVDTDWLCFLDADDELDVRYHEAMDACIEGGIKRPATLGIVDGIEDDEPYMIERADLQVRNFVVIGAFIRHEDFARVGGFSDDPVLEDWDLWIRLHLDGAEIVDVPDAIYRVHVRDDSRNSPHGDHHRVYSTIKNRYRDRWNVVKELA